MTNDKGMSETQADLAGFDATAPMAQNVETPVPSVPGEDAETLLALKNLEKRRADKKRKRRVRIAAVLGAAAVIAAVAVFLATQAAPEEEGDAGPEIAYASLEDFETTVQGSGALNPFDTVVVTPEVEGIIDSVAVAEGQEVHAGDVLFTLRNAELDKAVSDAADQVSTAEQAVGDAKKEVSNIKSAQKKAKKAYKKAKAQADADMEKAQKAYEEAYAKAMAGPEEKLAEAEADAKAAADEFAKAKEDLAKAESDLKKADDSGKAAAEAAVASAEAALSAKEAKNEAAQSTLKVRQGNYEAAVAKAESEGEKAQANVKVTEVPEYSDESYESQLSEARSAVSTAQDALDTANKAYNEAVAQTEKRVVKAPQDGTLVSFGAVVGAAVGEGSSETPLAQIADISKMKVSIDVNETDINNVEKGMAARCTFSAMPDLELKGSVVSVASTAGGSNEEGWGNGGVVNFPVVVVIDKPDPALRLGMTVNVDVLTQSVPDALVVPTMAVMEDEDGSYVEVVTDEESMKTEKRKVTLGPHSASQTVVKSGLSEGEGVVLSGSGPADALDVEGDDMDSMTDGMLTTAVPEG